MTLPEKQLAQVKVASTAAATPTTIYTGTATDIIKTIVITNTHTADVTVTIWNVPNGGSANVVDYISMCNATTIPMNDFVQITTYRPMQTTGQKITAICSVANGANIELFGASIT
jgi:hypothetical protein